MARRPGAGSTVRLATRGSELARLQTSLVAALLEASSPGLACEVVVVSTKGDRLAAEPLDRIGGQGVFVKEIETAVLEGRADVAVHSAKDLPGGLEPGLVLAAVPQRADPRDALVGQRFDELPPGATVATGSARRRAQLANLRPDLRFIELRGNMRTRVAKAHEAGVDASIVARCALERLGWLDEVAEVLTPSVMLPQVGQGSLALECRADDEDVAALLAAIDDPLAHRTLRAERALLGALGANCATPLAGFAEEASGGGLMLQGLLASGDGRIVVRATARGDDPEALGREVARALIEDAGAPAIEGWEIESREIEGSESAVVAPGS
jgi:hydroxymethylbilane synthase